MINKIHIIFILIIILTISSCVNKGVFDNKVDRVMTNKIEHFCKMQDDLRLKDCWCSCTNPDKIIHVSFVAYREFDQNEAKEFFSQLLDNLFKIVNSTEGMRDYLNDSPCSISNFHVLVLFSDPKKRFIESDLCDVTKGKITSVGLSNGYVYYSAYDFELKGKRWIDKELCLKPQSIAKFGND